MKGVIMRRNELCGCQSGKKFKFCCGLKDKEARSKIIQDARNSLPKAKTYRDKSKLNKSKMNIIWRYSTDLETEVKMVAQVADNAVRNIKLNRIKGRNPKNQGIYLPTHDN